MKPEFADVLPSYSAPSLSDRYAQGSSRLQRDLRSVPACAKCASADRSLEDRSRLRPVNGTSAGRSLKAKNKKAHSLFENRL